MARSFRRISPPSDYDRLKQAEQDDPGLIFCASCNAIHRRPIDKSSPDIGGRNCAANASSQRLQLGGCRSLKWWQVHLAVSVHKGFLPLGGSDTNSVTQMRAERFSPAHGISLCKKMAKWECWDWHYERRMRMVHDKLFVRVTATKIFTLMERNNGLEDAPCCIHLKGTDKIRGAIQNAILDFTAAGAPARSQRTEFRCYWCPSIFQIVVSRCEGVKHGGVDAMGSASCEGRYQLSVCRYIDLGQCESIKSPEWPSLTTGRKSGVRGLLCQVKNTLLMQRMKRTILEEQRRCGVTKPRHNASRPTDASGG